MHIIERGSGPALVLIPGIQGRWEYVRPAVDVLSASFRVLTFSLADEPSSEAPFDAARAMDSYAAQVQTALDERAIGRATVCGISFGGLVAMRFAADHPDRAASLILVSPPGPAWHLSRRHAFYAKLPHVFGLLFLAETPWRIRPELFAALPRWPDRGRFAAGQIRTLASAPLSLTRMAARARVIETTDISADCARITTPTLVVTGEPSLDRIVPVASSARYLTLIRGARGAVLERTGHLGSIAQPAAFAALVREFANGRGPRQGAATPAPRTFPASHAEVA